MGVPLTQMMTVARYVLGRRLRRVRRYPLVLMLEPLFRCNLACGGCGKIQFPSHVLKRQLTPEQCWRAAEECGAPIVSIPGGEPLLHPDIAAIVDGLVRRKRFVYLCTNALKLVEMLPLFRPTKYLALSIHVDGPREHHDRAVARDGVFEIAMEAIRAARSAGFRVTTNTTVFADADPAALRTLFGELMRMGVEGLMISPGYGYSKAPDQANFLSRDKTRELFRKLLDRPDPGWRFNHTPLFLEFLKGRWDFECTPWGNPTYNVFGWQKPCYLLDDGYCETFRELMDSTDWDAYGRASGNVRCRDCMVHCGYEPSAVNATFGSWRGFLTTARLSVFGERRSNVPGTAHASSLARE